MIFQHSNKNLKKKIIKKIIYRNNINEFSIESQICNISEIMEDTKENISDNEYKIIMDNLMNLYNKI